MIAFAERPVQSELVVESDGSLHAAADALATSKYGPLRKLNCRVFEGVVEITGSVPTFYLKQLAQAAVLQLYPCREVRNLVQVSGESSVFVSRSCDESTTGGAD